MIDRSNWKRTKEYLEYRLHVDQISEGSWKLEKTYVRYLLEWAQENPFKYAPSIRPTLPEFLLSFRLDGSQKPLSVASIKKILATARRFFTWLSDYKSGYGSLKQNWVSTLKYRHGEVKKKIRKAVSLEQAIAIAKAPVRNLQEKRIQAAACFLFLSGMRVGAFVSMRLGAVDIDAGEVLQYPELGVRTKNDKKAKTFLLPITELIAVVKDWDEFVRSVLPTEGFWFAPFMDGTFEVDPNNLEYKSSRVSGLRKDLSAWLERVDLPYYSPHMFRHGHVQWGYLNAEKPAQRKAISENVMHSNEQITDGVYSSFQESELKNQIASLGANGKNESMLSDGDIEKIANLVVEKLKTK